MTMDNPVLPEALLKTIGILKAEGYEAYAVGGCVRDMLMGKKPSDYDVATNAEPQEIKRVFSAYKTIDTGIKHGTVTVVINGFHTEITTYRTDGKYTDNRRPDSVIFSKNILDDLGRRDFTVNSIAYSGGQNIIDAYGGVSDIKNRTIRCVGNAKERFNEDALRILRALRFSSVLGFTIEENTKNAVHICAHLLENISKERIFAEFKKLICGKNARAVLLEYRDVAERIFPGISTYSEYEYKTAADMVSLSENDFCLKTAAFFYFMTPEEARYQLCLLKSDNATKKRICESLRNIDLSNLRDEKQLQKFIFSNGYTMLFDALKLKRTYFKCVSDILGLKEAETALKTAFSVQANGLCCAIADLDINGTDIISAGLAEGRQIGILLKELLNAVIDKKVLNEKNRLIQYAKNIKTD